jgi:hypothetical protein
MHSTNITVGIVDDKGKRLVRQKVPCELKRVLDFLARYKKRIQGLAVESTYKFES